MNHKLKVLHPCPCHAHRCLNPKGPPLKAGVVNRCTLPYSDFSNQDTASIYLHLENLTASPCPVSTLTSSPFPCCVFPDTMCFAQHRLASSSWDPRKPKPSSKCYGTSMATGECLGWNPRRLPRPHEHIQQLLHVTIMTTVAEWKL